MRRLGNGIDTMARAAWFRYEVTWRRQPSEALLDALDGLGPFPPGSQAYANDIDRVEIRLDSTVVPKELQNRPTFGRGNATDSGHDSVTPNTEE